MRTRKSNPFHARNVVDGLEQPREITRRVVGSLVVVHDLAEQLHLPPSRFGRRAHLREDLRLRPHTLLPAGIRHNAKTAVLVTPFDNRDPGSYEVAPPGDGKRKR